MFILNTSRGSWDCVLVAVEPFGFFSVTYVLPIKNIFLVTEQTITWKDKFVNK